MTVEIKATGVRVIHLFTPVFYEPVEGADHERADRIELRAMTWGDTRRWQRGGFDGPDGVLVALMESVTGWPMSRLELLQYPDEEIFQREFFQHLPAAIRAGLAEGEYPIEPPAPGPQAEPEMSAENPDDPDGDVGGARDRDLSGTWDPIDEAEQRDLWDTAPVADGPGPIAVPEDVRRNPLGGPLLGVGQEVPIFDPGYAADPAADGGEVFREAYEPSEQAVTDPQAIAKGLGVDLGE